MCGFASTSDMTGTIKDSGGIAANYSNNEDCYFLIAPGYPSASITLTFSVFDTEPSWDYLRVYDGTDTSGVLLRTFTGSPTVPDDVVASSGNMYLYFHSDGNFTAPGFVASWTTTINPTDNSMCTAVTSSTNAAGSISELWRCERQLWK